MGKFIWSALAGIVGLVAGFLIGGGSGIISGSSAGSIIGVCKAAQAGVDGGMFDLATADKLVTITVKNIQEDNVPGKQALTSLASCKDILKL